MSAFEQQEQGHSGHAENQKSNDDDLANAQIEAEENETETTDVRIAMIGNVDSGKSTLIGVLISGLLDDGRGFARSNVLKHIHERQSGRTSFATIELIGYRESGEQVIPKGKTQSQRWHEIGIGSTRTVTLIDLCGHESYLKTTVFGLTGLVPDFAVVVIGANMGVSHMTREHISIACALNIPIIVCITKIDLAPAQILKDTRQAMARCLRAHRKLPYPIKSMENVEHAAQVISSDRIVPVFAISNVSGSGVDYLRRFVSLLKRNHNRVNHFNASWYLPLTNIASTSARREFDPVALETCPDGIPDLFFPVDGIYDVKGVGVVFGGTLLRGYLTLPADDLLLGPDRTGEFVPITVRSMETRRSEVDSIKRGQSATLSIRPNNRKFELRRDTFRKGCVILRGVRMFAEWEQIRQSLSAGWVDVNHDEGKNDVDDDDDDNKDDGPVSVSNRISHEVYARLMNSSRIIPPQELRSIWEFDASVIILHHATTITRGYQPVIHCGVLRQSARMCEITPTGSVFSMENMKEICTQRNIMMTGGIDAVSAHLNDDDSIGDVDRSKRLPSTRNNVIHDIDAMIEHQQAAFAAIDITSLDHTVTSSSSSQAGVPPIPTLSTTSTVDSGVDGSGLPPMESGGPALRTGEGAKIRFRFMYHPEYMLPGSIFLFREGRAKGIGRVIKIILRPGDERFKPST